MPYRIAGIDVHKKKLAVVVADVEVEEEYQFERRWYGSNPEQLQGLAEWLIEQQTEEVVMESTAQYWKPLWSALERYWKTSCQNREGADLGFLAGLGCGFAVRYSHFDLPQQSHNLLRLVSLVGHDQLSFKWILSFHLVQKSPVTSVG